jgi:hypothetical protein
MELNDRLSRLLKYLSTYRASLIEYTVNRFFKRTDVSWMSKGGDIVFAVISVTAWGALSNI